MNPLIWLGTVAAALSSAGSVMEEPVKTSPVAPARDGDIAIREELCAARKADTIAAYDLFLARHPGHQLSDTARKERAAILDRR